MEKYFDEEKHIYFIDGKPVPSVTEITAMLNPMPGGEVVRQAARRGTAVHELTELVDYECDLDGIEVEPELAPYLLAYFRFKRDYKPDWEMVEQKLYSDPMGFAGTLDRFGKIDGTEVLLDIKTTASPSRQTKVAWAAQLAGYALLLDKPDAMLWVLQLKKDGSYTVFDMSGIQRAFDFDPFKLFLTLLRIREIIKPRKEK